MLANNTSNNSKKLKNSKTTTKVQVTKKKFAKEPKIKVIKKLFGLAFTC